MATGPTTKSGVTATAAVDERDTPCVDVTVTVIWNAPAFEYTWLGPVQVVPSVVAACGPVPSP